MLWTAIILGFLGSFHCVGMCGPIALAVGGANRNKFIGNKILYHIGRSITYAFLGLIVGGLGFSLALAGIQQGLSIGMGVLILIFAISSSIRPVSVIMALTPSVKKRPMLLLGNTIGLPEIRASGNFEGKR